MKKLFSKKTFVLFLLSFVRSIFTELINIFSKIRNRFFYTYNTCLSWNLGLWIQPSAYAAWFYGRIGGSNNWRWKQRTRSRKMRNEKGGLGENYVEGLVLLDSHNPTQRFISFFAFLFFQKYFSLESEKIVKFFRNHKSIKF